MPETVTLHNPEQMLDRTDAQAAHVQPALSRAALEGVGVAAQHFYGADEHLVGKTFQGEHRLLVGKPQDDGSMRNETVGSGNDTETALHDSLKIMRSLETVKTKSLAHIEMTETASVDFTSFAHYSPKVAPSRSTYPVPGHLEAMLTSGTAGIDTYTNTVSKEGWQTELRGIMNDYVTNDSAGRMLVAGLKVSSLDHLTPEQAVKLSAAFVQSVSKYTNDNLGNPDGSRADGLTAPELLREGIDKNADPAWEGNGVCRNMASNVKAVFESLKQTQGELSMLNNSYAVYGVGMNGDGYTGQRENDFKNSLEGHAWNTFVTVDSKGSAVATIVDATWALGMDADTAIEHLDRTEIRAAAQIMDLFEQSERKLEAFEGVSDYTQQLMRGAAANKNPNPSQRDNLRDFAVSLYLKAAEQLEHMPADYTLPNYVMTGAYRLRGRLERQEVATLFELDRAGGSFELNRIKALLPDYDTKRDVPMGAEDSARNLIFQDPALQELAYEAVGPDRVAQLAEISGGFRMKLRQQHPGELPAFDPYARTADAKEMSYIASRSGIHDKDPKAIMRTMNRVIKRLAGDEAVAAAIVTGRSDYDLVTNYRAIVGALTKKQARNAN